MSRYLINFSYLGTYFRGSQKQTPRSSTCISWSTVQECLESALQRLHPLETPSLILSSRTDSGVHALDSTAHFHIQKRNRTLYECEHITSSLNRLFCRKKLAIVVTNTRRVPDEFSARFSAISRSYLYRIAVPKPDAFQGDVDVRKFFPIQEWGRSYLYRHSNFEIEKFKEAAKLFEGVHDFRTFKKTTTKCETSSVRTLYSIAVSPGSPLTKSVNSDKFEFWDVRLRGRSFVHNQIRRMIGTLNCVAVGKLNLRDVRIMLQVPSKHNWLSFIYPAPACGLYLTNVEYNPDDLLMKNVELDNDK